MKITFQKHRPLSRSAVIILISIMPLTSLEAAVKTRGTLLGPTGIRGEMLTWPPPPKEFITVTMVDEGSPNTGKLKEGDVIVGFGNEMIKGNPQYCLAKAIDEAETEAAGGKLTVLLKTGDKVDIQLPVMGTYSPTAPYDCPKSEKIIHQTAELVLKTPKLGQSPTRADLLGLMATGEKKYIDAVTKIIKEDRLLDIDPQKVEGFLSGKLVDGGPITAGWGWGYNLITLAEYHLLTKDESVLPMIRTYALGLARGQDASGCWGHRMMTADSGNRLPGYAQMNQPSLSNFMAMIMARKCGIKDAVLDQAIDRTNAYVADHVDRGCFPYGVGGPNRIAFNNNGMSGSAAICMSLLGNKHGAKYFSQCAATTYDDLTSGHANTFFNPLWTPLGAALSGPEVTQQFFRKSLWYFNNIRDWKGGFPGSNGTAGVYSGQALLMYCLPRKALLITGREADPSIWLKGAEATEVIMTSKLADASKSTEDLLKLIDHPSPQIPAIVASILMERTHLYRRQKKADDISPKIMAMIENGSPRQKANALACFGPRYQVPFATPYLGKIGSILRDKKEPLQVRMAAASALGSGVILAAAHPYYNDVLQLVFEERTESDPFNHTDVKLAQTLNGICSEPLKQNVPVDKDLFYKTALRFLDHKRQTARAVGTSMLRGMPLEDFHLVGDQLVHVLNNNDPTYQSYHGVHETVAPGIEVLAGLNIKEGMDLLTHNALVAEGKDGFKAKMVFQVLPLYGGNAKPYVETFRASKLFANVENSRFKGSWEAMVKAIEEDRNPKKLISLEEAKKAGKAQ